MGAGVNKMIGDPCIFVRLIFVIKFICYFCIVFVKANRNRKSSKYLKIIATKNLFKIDFCILFFS
jgi:hypothetical protein